MTIVIEGHPLLSAVVASVAVVMFVAGSVWLAGYSLRKRRSKQDRNNVRNAVIGVAGTVFWLVLGASWWWDWSPWAVELSDNAVELKYLLSTQRIELAKLERVEFELVPADGRWRERSIVRLSAGGRVYQLTQDPEPTGELATRPIRRIFDQLKARLPPNMSRDLAKRAAG